MTTLKARLNDAECELMRYGKMNYSLREEIKELKKDNQKLKKYVSNECDDIDDLKNEVAYLKCKEGYHQETNKRLHEELKAMSDLVIKTRLERNDALNKDYEWEAKYANVYEKWKIIKNQMDYIKKC